MNAPFMGALILALHCPPAYSSAMRDCHQTCAELLSHDAECERACSEKDLHPALASFCPEHASCLDSCDAKFPGARSGSAWGDCRDICVALYIRVNCAEGPPAPPGSGGAGARAQGKGGSPGAGGQGRAELPSSPGQNAGVVPQDPRERAGAPAPLPDFGGKGRLSNVKAKGPLKPNDGLERIVQAALSGDLATSANVEQNSAKELSELTLFERVHGKYRERAFALEDFSGRAPPRR